MFSVIDYHGLYAVIEEDRRTATRVYIKRVVEGRIYGSGFIDQSKLVGSFRDEAEAVAAYVALSDLDTRHTQERHEMTDRHRAELASLIRSLALQESTATTPST